MISSKLRNVLIGSKAFLATSLAWMVFATTTASAMPPLLEPEVERLPNGLMIAWYLDDRLPFVDMHLSLPFGRRNDPDGKSGTAELLAESLDRGAGGLSLTEISDRFENLGASRAVSADEDRFAVSVSGLSQDAPTLLDLMGKMALKPDLATSGIERNRERLLSQFQHIADEPGSLASLALYRAMNGGTAYGRGPVKSIRELAKVDRKAVLALYHAGFRPQGSILMIIGRADRKKLGAQIASVFGDWSNPTAPILLPKQRFKDPLFSDRGTADSPIIYVIHRPDSNQTQVRFGFPAPMIKDPDRFSITIANAALGETFHSRLNGEIRDRLGLTYGINSSIASNELSSYFVINAATRTEATGELIQKTLASLKEFQAGKIHDEEITDTKSYLTGGFPLSVATLPAVANRWLSGVIYKMGPEYFNGYVAKIEAQTPEMIRSALKRRFKLDHLAILVAGDAPGITESLKKAGFKRIKQVKPEQMLK